MKSAAIRAIGTFISGIIKFTNGGTKYTSSMPRHTPVGKHQSLFINRK